ncbi:MAG: outer membrane protein transport protein [Gammaproteobacteria bacterium]|nr:outer membrane protein transport protein [Gammaproteobacteria bacterium]
MLLSLTAYGSFIESTLGTAVVNDATASYFNPAALVLLKNPQFIPQETFAHFHTQFTGRSTLLATNTSESGRSSSNTGVHSPSFYLGVPATSNIVVGLAIVSNAANRNAEENSILRYVQANNTIQDYDVVPALALKINEFLSIGAGVNFSYAKFNAQPIIGFPGSNIADSQSSNKSDGSGLGFNAGFLFKASPTTLLGFNYRSMTTYGLSGTSIYEGNPRVVSNNYHFKLRTPARSVFSINHFFTDKLGLISTIQYIQWSAITQVHVYGVANLLGTQPTILNGSIPYYLRDTWLATLGSHYRITPKWVLRLASTFSQSAGNPHYQIDTGDSIVVGASMGYEINKMITIDGSYAHVLIQNENIAIAGPRYIIQGVNKGSREAVSLKLTFNL